MLGPLEVVDGGRDVTPSRPKQRALLALLLLRAGELVTVDEALEALWGEQQPAAARNALQGHVTALRKTIGAERIETRGAGYVLRLQEADLDLDRFERLVTDARGRPPEERRTLLADALALFRGAPLADLRYESFARPDADRIEQLRLAALEDRIEAELALGRHRDALPELERLTEEHPLRERLHEQLMLALYRSGRQADALDAYRRARRAFSELGLEPGPALRRMERRILEHDVTLDLPPPPSSAMPSPPTPLVGREQELAQAAALLLRADVRILTLTGAGGSGKTRLALELARRTAPQFRDSVAFVPLAPLTDPELVLPTVARVLDLPDTPSGGTPEALAAQLAERETLIVLDNLEHLLACVPALGAFVAAAPAIKLLTTSREPVRIYGEHLFPVPPLANDAATELFLDRAEAVRPDLDRASARDVAAAICQRLDGLPLAIELAAAQVATFSPEALLERLDDRLGTLVAGPRDQPERQQTLRRTLEWSHELLLPDLQRLIAQLSVFAGGWTLDAADAVCGDGFDVVGGVAALADKSLVELPPAETEPRPHLLETIREFALKQLESSGHATAVRERHAAYFVELAEGVEPHLPLSRREVLERLELEHDNVRTALDWLERSEHIDALLRLTGAIWRFWYLRGYLSEGRRRVESALGADDSPTLGRAKTLNGAAAFAINAGDVRTARRRAEEALALHRNLGDENGAAYAGFMLANTLVEHGEEQRALELYEESVRVFRATEMEPWALLATRHLAYLHDRLGDSDRARALHEENLRRARESGNDRFVATSLSALAEHAVAEGRVDDALSMLTESLRAHRALGDVLDTAVDLAIFASALARAGRAETAARLVGALDSLAEEIGVRRNRVAQLSERTLEAVRSRLDVLELEEALEHGRMLTIGEAVELALDDSSEVTAR